MAVTTSSVLRPTSDLKLVGVRDESTNLTGSASTRVDDGGQVVDFTGADDATFIYAAAGIQYPNASAKMGLADLPAPAANQRIKQLRIRTRIRMNSLVTGDSAIVHLKLTDPQSGLGIPPSGTSEESTPIYKVETGSTTVVTRTSPWYPKPPPHGGDEWTRAIINRLYLHVAWYYGAVGVVNLRVTELYVDVDVRDRGAVATVTASNYTASTRPTVAWSYTPNGDGDPQVAWMAKVFSAAQYGVAGFDPETSPATWYSGLRYGGDAQAQVGVDLANGGTYKAYVRAAQDFNGDRWWSDWVGSSAFTVGLAGPLPAPTLSVTSDPTVPNLRNVLQFTATVNALAAQDADLEEAGTGGWFGFAGCTVSRSAAQARHGTGSLAVTADVGNAGWWCSTGGLGPTNAVAVRPGQEYTATGYVRANSTGRAIRAVLRYHDETDTYVGQTNGSTVTDSSGAWTQLPAVTGTVPSGAVYLYFQLETLTTLPTGEVHYGDQFQIVPGATAPAWMPGILGGAYAVLEAAIATGQPRNMASRQLYGGGDDTRDASGFYSNATISSVVYDMLDRVRGIGAIRWDIEHTGAKLYIGWPATTLDDPAPAYALPAVPGRTYTFSVYLRATTPFSSQLNLQAINAGGSSVGSATNGGPISVGTGWVRYSATITAPAGAVYVRPHLDNTAAVTGRKLWLDAIQWELASTPTDLTRPGGVALDWVPVRGFTIGKTLVPAGTQSLVAFDHEVPPGYTVIYRAWIYATEPISGSPLSSALTSYATTMIDPPGAGQWVLSEVAGSPFLRGRVHVLPGRSYSQPEDVTAYHPIRPRRPGQVGQRPVALSDWIGGHDGTLQIPALSDDDFWLLERLLDRQDPLWFTESQGGGKYIRLTDRNWVETRFRDKCVNLADGTRLEANEYERVLTLQYINADRPPDNEAAVLYGVEPATTIPGGEEEPPPDGELVYPGPAVNWISVPPVAAGTTEPVLPGGGFQNTFAVAPTGVGHALKAASGADVAGVHVTADRVAWTPSNEGLPETGMRVAGLAFSAAVADRLYAYVSSATGAPVGGVGGRLMRGTYSPTSGTVTWAQVASFTNGAAAGGNAMPRQTGRILALDEANDTAYVGTIDGIHRITGISGTGAVTAARALAGAAVTGLVLNPADPNLGYATVDSPAGSAGIWRVANIRSGTVAATRNSTFTNPQDLVVVDEGSQRVVYAACMAQGVQMWTAGADITTGWTSLTTGLTLGSDGVAAIDARGTGTATKLLVSMAGTATTLNAGAWSNDRGSTWSNESTGWTVSDSVRGYDQQWWLTAANPFYSLSGNGWDSMAVRIDPADPAIGWMAGRSGVWTTLDSGVTWRPAVKGLSGTVSWGGQTAPTGDEAILYDGDWGPIELPNRAVSMARRIVPDGNEGTGMGVAFRQDTARVALALGDWSASVNGEVYIGDPPYTAWTDLGFSAVPDDRNACGVAVGLQGGTEIVLTLRDGTGIQRKAGAAAPTTVSTGVTTGFYSLAKFWWPNSHTGTQPVVFLSATNGLWRSPDYGATWARIHTYTNSSEYTGRLVGLPSDPVNTLFLTIKGSGTAGLYKVTGAAGTSTLTLIKAATDPGPCAVNAAGEVYLAVTANEPGGAKLYRSNTTDPDAGTTWLDLSDARWRGGVVFPSDLSCYANGDVLAANKQGGYFVFAIGSAAATCCNASSVATVGGVVQDFGGNAGCNTAGSAPFTPAGPYSQWGIAGTHRRLEWKLRIDDDEAGEGHFWALESQLQGSSELMYAGLQRGSSLVASPGKLALFSVWDAIAAVAGTADGAVASPFSETGGGYSVYAPFAWTLGATYTLRVQADDPRGADWWRFDVVDDASAVRSYIGSVQVPAAWGDISGTFALAFSEWFTNEGGLTSCLQVPRVTAFFGTPGFSSTLGPATSGGGTATAQPMLLGLHRPIAGAGGSAVAQGFLLALHRPTS